jgi:hypothetical protein
MYFRHCDRLSQLLIHDLSIRYHKEQQKERAYYLTQRYTNYQKIDMRTFLVS